MRESLLNCALVVVALMFESAAAQEPSTTTSDPPQLANPADSAPAAARPSPGTGNASGKDAVSSDRIKDFVRAVLGDTEDVWTAVFGATGNGSYPMPTVVLIRRSGISACGLVKGSSGPSYCPGDRSIYVDPAYLDDVAKHFGDFAAAYLIAHEVGRHVQSVLHGTQRIADATTLMQHQEEVPPMPARSEMQADCYAGVWTYFVAKRGLLDPGDLEQAPTALTVGKSRDDTEYMAQRLRWFRQGLSTGNIRSCEPGSLPERQ